MNIQARVNELLDLAGCLRNISVEVKNFGIVAGDVDETGKQMRINKQVVDNYPEHLDKLIIHETAHVVDMQRHGWRKDAHGKWIHHDKVFYDICRELGDPNPSRTYDDSIELKPMRKYRQFQYHCACLRGSIVKTPTHNKIQKKYARYICTECNTEFGKENYEKEI